MLKTWLRRAFFGISALILLIVAADVLTYDPKPWLADYTRLKHDMAQGYANLDWIVEKRGVDLPALDRETTTSLQNAHSRVRAFLILRSFIRSFNDPHFRMKPGKRPAPVVTPAAASPSAQKNKSMYRPARTARRRATRKTIMPSIFRSRR